MALNYLGNCSKGNKSFIGDYDRDIDAVPLIEKLKSAGLRTLGHSILKPKIDIGHLL